MAIYLLVLFLCVIGTVFCTQKRVVFNLGNNRNISNSNWFFWFVALLMLLLVAFRDVSVGIDTMNYYNTYLFYSSSSFGLLKNMSLFDEPGYIFLMILFNKMGISVSLYSLFMASLYLIPIYLLILKSCDNSFFSLLLFVLSGLWFYSMSTMRQAAAIGITVIAFLVKEKKLLKLLLVLTASMIHISAIIFVIYFVISPLHITKKNMWIWSLVGVLIIIVGLTPVKTLMFQIISRLDRSYQEVQSSAGILQEVFFIITLILVFIFTEDYSQDRFGEYVKMLFLAAVILPVVSINPTLFRIYQYFSIYQIVLVPKLLQSINNKGIRVCGYAGYLLVYSYLFIQSLDSSMKLVPYLLIK